MMRLLDKMIKIRTREHGNLMKDKSGQVEETIKLCMILMSVIIYTW